MILELRAFGTRVQRDVHSLRERLELASGGAHASALSKPHISPIRQMCILAYWRPPRAGEEAGQRVGIELQGVPRGRVRVPCIHHAHVMFVHSVRRQGTDACRRGCIGAIGG